MNSKRSRSHSLLIARSFSSPPTPLHRPRAVICVRFVRRWRGERERAHPLPPPDIGGGNPLDRLLPDSSTSLLPPDSPPAPGGVGGGHTYASPSSKRER